MFIFETLKEIINKIIDVIKKHVTNNHLSASEKAVADMSLDDVIRLRTQFLDVIDGAIANLENGAEIKKETKYSRKVEFQKMIDSWAGETTGFSFVVGDTNGVLENIRLDDGSTIYTDVVKIATTQGRSHIQSLLKKVLYIDSNKKRVKQWLNANRLQLPLRSSTANSINIIAQNNKNGNTK